MGTVKSYRVNDTLLGVSYSNPGTIKMLFKNWNMLESLSQKGDTVALSILIDLKKVTGFDHHDYSPMENNKKLLELKKFKGELSYKQFIAISYVLVYGYSQEEVANMLDINQSVLCRHISKGLKVIQNNLKETA